MVGIECQESTAHLIQKIMHNGLLTLSAGEKVIRLLPPLTVTTDEIDQAVVCLQEILQKQKVTI